MRYGDVLKKKIEEDNRFFVLTAENMGPIYYIIDDIKENYLDVGISEQTMIGIAVGLALRGRIPVVHAMSSFLLMRPFEFIRTDIGYGNLNIKLVGTAAGFLSEKNGPTHQCIEDISLMKNIPNMHVYAPADNDDMTKMEKKILEENMPSYLRYNDMEVEYSHEEFEIGKAEVIGKGKDIAIITYGTMFKECLKLKRELEKRKIGVTLLNLRTIIPIDEKRILEVADYCDKIIVVEDHFEFGGCYEQICEILFKNKKMKDILAINLKNYFKAGSLEDVIKNEGFSVKDLIKKIDKFL